MELLYHAHSLSVVGITEALLKLPHITNVFLGLRKSLDQEKPDLVILIDFPDFNLRLARMAHQTRDPHSLLYQSSGMGVEAEKD